MAFLKDPKGPPLWEEDPGAKDVVHIDSEKVIYSPSLLMDAGSFPKPGSPEERGPGTEKWECPELGQGPDICVVLQLVREQPDHHRLAA